MVPRRRAFRLVWDSCARRINVACSIGSEAWFGSCDGSLESEDGGRAIRRETIWGVAVRRTIFAERAGQCLGLLA